jgi:hypothetical protein
MPNKAYANLKISVLIYVMRREIDDRIKKAQNSACDAVDGFSTGIAICRIAVSIDKLSMTGYGT